MEDNGLFPPGPVKDVTCTARDGDGNTASCSFQFVVIGEWITSRLTVCLRWIRPRQDLDDDS